MNKLQTGGYFGEVVKFNPGFDKNSKIVTTKVTQFLVLPKIQFYPLLSILDETIEIQLTNFFFFFSPHLYF